LVRALAPAAEKILGQPIVVENKPGGTGALAMGLLKSAKPDGYTLAACTDTPFTRIPHTIAVNYDPLKDFTYITELGRSRIGLVVKSDSPFKTFQDLLEFARKNPGQLTHGTPGVANTTHLAMEKIAQIEKVKIQHVFFQGSAPTITAILGGHVMCASTVAVGWISHVKAGNLRPLLIYDPPEGIEQWPEIPTIKRLNYGFESPIFEVVAAPRGVPKPIADKIIVAFSEALKSPQFQTVAREQETIQSGKPLTGNDLYKSIDTQFNFYGALIKELGLQKK
jgi:tripartite-type tricarboxylate transporter receptor subunit TctC